MLGDDSVEHVSAGWAYFGGFVREASRAIRGRAVQSEASASVTREIARQVFEQRSASPAIAGGDDVVALASIPYQLLAEKTSIASEFRALAVGATVLDFGCGTAPLLDYLRRWNVAAKYVGYDIDHIGVQQMRARNRANDVEFFVADDALASFDIAVLCNVLVYNQQDESLNELRRLRRSAKEAAKIVVLEPYPRWYWELVFDGIRLCASEPEEMCSLLRAANWEPYLTAKVSMFAVGQRQFLPIAYGIVASV